MLRLSKTPSWVDEALEAVGPLAGDPVHHVAAVGSAQRAHAIAVQPRILFERRRESELQILERFAAPVAADRIGERLAVAGGAVEIDHHHGIAGAGESLCVPSPMPDVSQLPCGPPCTTNATGYFPLRLKSEGFHDVAEHILVVPAAEVELLVRAEFTVGERGLIEVSEVAGFAAGESHGVQVGGIREIAQACRRPGWGPTLKASTSPSPVMAEVRPVGASMAHKRTLSQVVGRWRTAALPSGAQAKLRDGAIPVLGERPLTPDGKIQQHQMKAVGLESGSVRGEIGELRAVGREGGLPVPGGIVGGQVLRLAARGGNFVDVEIGGPGLAVVLTRTEKATCRPSGLKA